MTETWNKRHRRCLMIVVKEPVVGQVKTRLAAGVGADGALALYRAFVADTIALARQVPGVDIALVYWPEGARTYFESICADGLLLPQRGRDLGERLLSGFEQTHAAGYEHCIVLSSDSPSLPVAYLVQAFQHLADVPVVLGPCEDGGYYLIGLHEPLPVLFDGVAWSTALVYDQTMERAAAAGLAVATLPPWYDIDTRADLERLQTDLAGRADGIPSATLAVLNRLAEAAARNDGKGAQ